MHKIDKKYLNYFTTRSILGKIAQSSNTTEQTKLLEDYKQTIPKTENGKLNLKTIFEKTNTEVKKLNSEEKIALKSHKSDTARDNKMDIAKKEVEITEKELNL